MKKILFIITLLICNITISQENLKDYNQEKIIQGDVIITLYLRDGQSFEKKDSTYYVNGNDFYIKLELTKYKKKNIILSHHSKSLTNTKLKWTYHYKSNLPKNIINFNISYFALFGKIKLIDNVRFVCFS
jgi:UPF0288 family protein (methanogenesis marker protein 3)